MQAPPKPWENTGLSHIMNTQSHLPYSEGMQSTAPNLGTMPVHHRSIRNAPPLPPRPRHINQHGLGFGNSNVFSSFPSYGGFGSGFSNYNSYNSYGGYGGYGGFGNYGGYGSYGMSRLGFSRGSNPESRFIQMAEEGSRPAFQSIESLVQAFGSVSFMLESTFNAMYSSFRAVLGVAENFGRLRALFGQFLSVFAIFRWFQWLFRKFLYILGVYPNDPSKEALWKEASKNVPVGDTDPIRQRTTWPIMVFLGIVLSGPYLMWKLLGSLNIPNIDPHNPKDWVLHKDRLRPAVALYDFVAGSDQELSFRAGQKLLLAPKECQPNGANWLLAAADFKKVGFIPANYVKIAGYASARQPAQNVVPAPDPLLPAPENEIEIEDNGGPVAEHIPTVHESHIPGPSGDGPVLNENLGPVDPVGNEEEPLA